MRVVWKYLVPIQETFSLEMPKGAMFLSVQWQNGDAVLWVLCDPEEQKVHRLFRLAATGEERNDLQGTWYRGTFQTLGGQFVFHLFEG